MVVEYYPKNVLSNCVLSPKNVGESFLHRHVSVQSVNIHDIKEIVIDGSDGVEDNEMDKKSNTIANN